MKNIHRNSNFRFTKLCVALIAALMTFATTGWGQTTVPFTTSSSWTCPAGVTSVAVECWGGGGAGGSATGSTSFKAAAGGGAGGSYVKANTIPVTPGNSYTVTVGVGGTASSSNGTAVAGGDSWFSSATTVIAKGGAGANSLVVSSAELTSAGGVGSTTGCIGDTKFAGGSGSAGTTPNGSGNSGAGGSSAGTQSAGNAASGSTGGTAPTGGGAGAGGRTSSGGGGTSATGLGGGGAGGWATISTTLRAGGSGARGKVSITYTVPTITGVATATAFTTTYGTASAAQSFTVSGAGLTASLVATAPTGFEVSADGTTYGSTATFTQTSGSASGTLRVRLGATAAVSGAYNTKNVVLSSTGATAVNIVTASTGNSITAKGLTITGLSAANKNWDGNTTVSATGTPVYSVLANGESFSVTGTVTWAFPDANVGTSKTLTRTGSFDAPSANYTVTQPTLTANIVAVVPSEPTIGTITPGDGQLSVAFTAPTSSGGVSITNYKYSIDGGALVSVGSTSSPFIITGLTNDQSYGVRLYAVNSAGDSLASLAVNATPLAPSSPTITVAPATFGSAFSTTYGTASSTQTFTVSGSTLSGDVTVTAPAGTEISLSSGSGHAGSLVLAQTSGSVSSTTIYARLKATAAAGSYNGQTFTVSSTDATTQNVGTTASGNVVGQAALTITGIGIANKAYDRATTATITGTAEYGGLQNGESFSVTGTPSASFATATVGLAKPVTVTGYTAPNSNYSLTQPTPAADISAVGLTVTGATVTPKSYDGNTAATITGATLNGVISPDVVTLTGGTSGTLASANVGTGIAVSTTMGITGADAGNYSFTAPTGLTGEITKATAAITFGALPSGKKVGDAAFSAGATTTAGTLSYSSSNPNVASVNPSSGLITLVAPGVTTITASVVGTANYNAATPVSQTLNVAGTTPSLTVLSENFASLTSGDNTTTIGQSSLLNGTSLANFPTVSSAYSAGGAVKLGVSGGTGSITSKTLDLSGNGGNYTVTFKVKGWTSVEGSIIVTPSVGSSQTVSYTAVIGGSFETKTLEFTGGTSSMTFSFATSAKRAFLDDIVITTAGGSTPAITPSGSFSALTTTYGAVSGTSATTVTVTGGSLTAGIVATAPTGFEVSNDGATYGATATFGQTGGFANGTLSLRLAANALAGSRSGNVVLSSAGATSVNVPTVASTVTAKALSVTAAEKTMIYGEADPALTYTSDGLVNGDSLTGSLARASGANVGIYAITQGSLNNANYDISFTGANFTITAASMASSAITLTPQSDGSYTASGPVGSTFSYSYAGRSANGITTSYSSATAPTAAGYYTVTATGTGNYAGSNTADYFVAGPVAVADSRTKSAGNATQLIPISELLANDRRISSTGTVETTGLTVTGVTSGSGNNAEIAGVFIQFTPSSASTDTFTYTVTDGTKTATATVTVTTETQAPEFRLQIVKVGTATFAGGNTTVTHDFIGVPNQTYLVEYKGDLAEASWTSAGAQSTGPTGSFSVTFTKAGDHTTDWNGSMLFQARRQ